MKYSVILISFLMILSIPIIDALGYNENKIIILEKKMMENIEEKNFEKALFSIDEILKIDPENINALNNKGGILIELGLNYEAVNNLNQVLQLDANNTKALNNKGIALIREQKVNESFDAFYNSLKIDPTNQIAFENIKKITERMEWIDSTNNGYVVISIEDSKGNLVAYSKAHSIAINFPLGYNFMKENGELHEVEVDGKLRTLSIHKNNATMNNNQFIGVFTMDKQFGTNKLKIIEMELNGIIIKAGDRLFYEIAILLPDY